MPNHPRSHIVMICTGTGSRADARDDGMAPAPAHRGKSKAAKLMLFFGARTPRGAAVLRAAA